MHQPNSAEELVGLGFRYWMRGCQTGNVDHWAQAWTLYSGRLGCQTAKTIIGELSSWVRLVNSRTQRSIHVADEGCAQFCADECLAVSMIAASQHKTCPAIRACAFALIEDSMIEEVVDQSDSFATMLIASDQVLSPRSILAGDISSLSPASGTYQ